ncbi:hypothetical protein C5167_044932 [Papaver somniferum]|uniref:Uncharacterized protein n=1 Tax=Papaver somniferum TaxID=3469 RepID=A0A4Y7LBT2_PAPSO|nr:hypothetical protein C5167_044932 [Papaver somniferum]
MMVIIKEPSLQTDLGSASGATLDHGNYKVAAASYVHKSLFSALNLLAAYLAPTTVRFYCKEKVVITESVEHGSERKRRSAKAQEAKSGGSRLQYHKGKEFTWLIKNASG